MKKIEKYISPLIENMFPSFYKEEGQNFITFVKAYYEWLEENYQYLGLEDASLFNVGDIVTQGVAEGVIISKIGSNIVVLTTNGKPFKCKPRCNVLIKLESNSGGESFVSFATNANPLYQARNVFSLRDIDTTLDNFIVHFKEKYLKNIQFNIATNKILLTKNSLDLYRSKGTERSIDLFFKLVYGVDSEVFYPGDQIFRLSDGEWVQPLYLEITYSSKNVNLVGKQITGVNSGATAFVEKYIKRKIKEGYVHILYVSNIKGDFLNNEVLKSDGVFYNDSPKLIGSLNLVEIITGGTNFKVGDVVSFTSVKGSGGLARVSSVSNTTGIVDFLLIESGWGYTSDADSIVSEKVLSISNVNFTNTTPSNTYFNMFETITQPLANIVYIDANNDFTVGQNVYTYSGISLTGTGVILDNVQDSANGEMFISVLSGTFSNDSMIYTYGNNISANGTEVSDKTATSKVMGISSNATLEISSIVDEINIGNEVYQTNGTVEFANAKVSNTSLSTFSGTISITNSTGTFKNTYPLLVRENSSFSANIDNISLSIGVYDVSGTYTSNAYIKSSIKNTHSTISSISLGYGADFNIGTLGEVEEIFINTDLLSSNNVGWLNVSLVEQPNQTFISLPLSNYAYGFPKNPQGNSQDVIFSCLNFDNFILGSIESLSGINPGSDYNVDPFVLVNQEYIGQFNRKDYIFTIANATGSFAIGERIVQTGANLEYYSMTVEDETGFIVGETIYQGANISTATFTAVISSITNEANNIVVKNSTGTLQNGANIYSVITGSLTTNVISSSLQSIQSTSKAIVKSNSNITTVYAKRIQFENTFQIDEKIVGQSSGHEAYIKSIVEDQNSSPIGLNATIEANVITSNGSVVSLEIIDSGYGYANGEIVEFTSEDGLKSGSAKTIRKGRGKGSGYFKSSKGFLSADMYVHDSDYYQEYSYEVLTRIPFDKYSEMFKKVMHTSGTKVFGSVVLADDSTVSITSANTVIEEEIS